MDGKSNDSSIYIAGEKTNAIAKKRKPATGVTGFTNQTSAL